MVALMDLVHRVDAGDHTVNPVLHLDIKGFLNFVEALHILQIAGGCAHRFSRGGIHAVIQRQQQNLAAGAE